MDTPSAPTVQGTKRSRINFDVTPTMQADDHGLQDAINLLSSDTTVPAHLNTIIGHLLDSVMRKDRELEMLRKRDSELIAENNKLKEEIKVLKSSLATSLANHSHSDSSEPTRQPNSCEESERARSVVVSGLAECTDSNVTARLNYDIDCVKKLFSYLDVECMPVTCYRMGRPRNGFPRLLKFVLPSTMFQSLLLKRAPRLRYFQVKGVYIRRSLTKEERSLRRARRASSSQNASQPQCSPPPSDMQLLMFRLKTHPFIMSLRLLYMLPHFCHRETPKASPEKEVFFNMHPDIVYFS
ncbi:unnamed protein product [Haemonchus placei]|uniref:BEN domain-containing protein n=1 Tax=Haemonchus placei TaxID=6290 RepID=A0A0N4WK55_HAEPC|nr:unnamed protein product [Haemonchus placei]